MTTEPPGDPEGYRLAWEEGRSGLLDQANSLRELRERAGMLVTLAGAVTGIVLAVVLDDGRGRRIDQLGVLGGVAAGVAFFTIVIAGVMIWRPFPARFVRDPSVIVDFYVEGDDPLTLSGIHRELALHLGGDLRQVVEEMEGRLGWFARALGAVVILHAGLAAMVLDVSR